MTPSGSDNKKNILVVDDEPLILYALSATFTDEEYQAMTADTGEAALKTISEHHFDACFLDINLPDMNGIELMKKIRHASPETKFLIMTAGDVTPAMMKSIQESAHLLMGKPFDLDVVKNFVDRILSTGRPLCKDEVNTLMNGSSFIKWVSGANRGCERKHVAKQISYLTVSPNGEHGRDIFLANVLDISESGIGIMTENKTFRRRIFEKSGESHKSIFLHLKC